MKAVILEKRGTEAAVLAENGIFMKVPCSGEIGDEIDISKNAAPVPRSGQRLMRGLAAAALILVVAGGAYHYTAVSVSAYVSVDGGGSSLEMKVNCLGQIISVESVGDEDDGLAEKISGEVRGMSVEDAVEKALSRLAENGKLTENSEPVIVGITSESDNGAESLENAIAQKVGSSVYTVIVSGEEREEAHRQEIGGGRYVYDRDETANALSDDDNDETEDDMISVIIPITAEDNVSDENPASEETEDTKTERNEQEKAVEIQPEDNDIQPAEMPRSINNAESAQPPERPDNGDTSEGTPQNERNEQTVPGQDQRPQTPDTETTGEMPQSAEMPQNGETLPSEPPQNGETQPLEMPQNGEQPAPPDNDGQTPERPNNDPPDGMPPQAGEAGRQTPDGQMPPMPAPMDGQQNMMPNQ